LKAEIRGESFEGRLPGRQGRMLFAYMAASRARPVSRDELMGALWPSAAPAQPGPALSTLLTRLRQTLGHGVVEGRRELWLQLPPDAWVDVEVLHARAARAEGALARGDMRGALRAAQEALALTEQRLLPEFSEPWVDERRREFEERRCAMLETCARAGVALGGLELLTAGRAARALVELNPYRESGCALLMQVCAARGDVAEALRVFDRLRTLLREELGVLPSQALVKLNDRLLHATGGLRDAETPAASYPTLWDATPPPNRTADNSRRPTGPARSKPATPRRLRTGCRSR
jgi:SARP family transcriptional regulator, regulator of embCAB operon